MSTFQLAWKFNARSSQTNRVVSGCVFSASDMLAIHKVRSMGFVQAGVQLDIRRTLQTAFGLAIPKEFNLQERARLYRTVANRLRHDGNLLNAIVGAQDFVQDEFLLSALGVMAAALSDGQKPEVAMRLAGFNSRDCMVVKALGAAGKLDKAFEDLGEEALGRWRLEKMISKALFKPAFMVGFMFVVIFAFLMWGAPRMTKFFTNFGSDYQMPGSIAWIYDLAGITAQAPGLFAVVWFSLGIGLLYSRRLPFWHKLAMQVTVWRNLALKSEHASVWSVYGLMYDAAIPPAEICRTLIPAVKYQETSESLERLSRSLLAGVDDVRAVERAEFPPFVIGAYKAAKQSGNLTQSLRQTLGIWQEDIQQSTERLDNWLGIASLFGMGLLALLGAFVIYFPMIMPVLTRL